MIDLAYLIFSFIFLLFINKFLLKTNILISVNGENHQKFASNLKVPLSGGIFIFFNFLYIIQDQLIVFLLLIFILGIFSDLKYFNSALGRLVFQISIVLLYVVMFDLQLKNTKIHILDSFLNYKLFNYLFVAFCILIVINGSNFLDGLNTLNIIYFFFNSNCN